MSSGFHVGLTLGRKDMNVGTEGGGWRKDLWKEDRVPGEGTQGPKLK